MTKRHLSKQEARERRGELRSLAWGIGSALLLTAVPFGLVAVDWLRRIDVLAAIAGCAVAQVAFQIAFFLHIDLSRQKREDLLLILFTGLLLAIMIGGTLWIMWNLQVRMAPGLPPARMPAETF